MRIVFGTALFSLMVSPAGLAYAQSAGVAGTVVDSSGGSIPGANITLLNTDTGIALNTVSSSDGNFILPPTAPGHYEIKVVATRFQPWNQTGITLEIGEQKAIHVVLSVGSLSEVVTVRDTPPELQIQNADRSTLLEPSFVANLPLDPRNPLQLIAATVGVTLNDTGTSGTNNTTESTTNQFRINGAKYGTTDLLIDGGANMVAYNNQAAGIPGVDATSEFRVLTTAYAPEYGNTSGGMVNMSIKSGTRLLHGGTWEYFRNQSLDANGYNANAAGEARPNLLRNQFGGQLGGPVIIPKLYNGRDKTFFFVSYEGLRDTYEPVGGFSALVPTDAMAGRNGLPGGDFSIASNAANYPASQIAAIYDPTNIVGGKRVQFTNNIIPANRLDAVGKKLMQLYPSPTAGYFASSSGVANYFSNATEGDTDNSFDLRMDHQFTAKQSIFGHYDEFSNKIANPDDYGNNQEPTNSNDRIPGIHALVSHTWAIKDNLVFTHHGSYGHSESNRASVEPLSPSTYFGFNAASAPASANIYTPQIAAVAGQLGAIGNTEPQETNKSSIYQYQADVTWLRGRHAMKFGTDIRRYSVQHFDPQGIALTGGKALTGGPAPTSAESNGNAIAEILLGYTPIKSGYQPLVTERDMVYAWYAEDTWKVTPKLTATYGLRYGIIGSWVTAGNLLNYLDPNVPSPIAGAAGLPNLVGGMGIPGVSISSRTEQDPALTHFEPRIGLAYALDQNTVIHAGFGIFRHPQAAEASYSELGGSARVSTSVSSQTVGSNVVIVPGSSAASPGYYTLGNPFFSGGGAPPAPYGSNPLPLAGNNVGSGPASINLGQNVVGDLRQQSDPYQEIFTFDVQRAYKGFVLTAGYVNNEGVRLRSAFQWNQLTDATLAQCRASDSTGKTCAPLTNSVTNPFYKVITDSSSALSLSTTPAGNLQKRFPQFTAFEPIDVGWAHSTYRALQMSLQHREANGLSVLVGYTYSKAIDQTGDSSTTASVQDNGCLRCERSISEQDATHVFVENLIYELPFGHGKPWLNSGAASVFAGGWQLGNAYKFNTGLPVQLTETATSLVGNGVLRPTIAPGVSLKSTAPNQAFNPAAFIATPAYEFGNAPRWLSSVRYPNYQNLDVFIQKQTRIHGDRMGVLIRFEALNAPNSVVFNEPGININSSTTFGIKSTSQTNAPRECQLSARFSF